MKEEIYGRITEVDRVSPAWKAGVRPGDQLVSVDGQPVRDVLDFQYLTADESFELEVRRCGRASTFHVSRELEEDLGIEFEEELFDGLRSCSNNCVFCFLQQTPKGLRKSLYVRDDDFRLSFAHGNYITLTNLTDEDMYRICSQRMSRLFISVHATDPELRGRIMGNTNAGRIMDQMRRFADARITMHTQIVVCPGINDGENLERSVKDLASLHPAVDSIAVVPVGLTGHREGLTPLNPVSAREAKETLDMCGRLQREFLDGLGTQLVYPSDEFYLLVQHAFPSADEYEGFPQLENGVGISRIFLDELAEAQEQESELRPGGYILVTGTLAAPMVQRLADHLEAQEGVSARVCAINNKFLGESITVAGLLTGRDIQDALSGCVSRDEEVLIPNVALNGDRFLDDMSVAELERVIRCRVMAVAPSPLEVIHSLCKQNASETAVLGAVRRGT